MKKRIISKSLVSTVLLNKLKIINEKRKVINLIPIEEFEIVAITQDTLAMYEDKQSTWPYKPTNLHTMNIYKFVFKDLYNWLKGQKFYILETDTSFTLKYLEKDIHTIYCDNNLEAYILLSEYIIENSV